MKRRARKKPVEITFEEWWPPGDPRHDPSMVKTYVAGETRQIGDLYRISSVPGMGDDRFMIRTLEGDMKVSPGDVIITGVKAERYACKPDIFALTYDVLD